MLFPQEKNLCEIDSAVRGDRDAYSRFGPRPVEKILPMCGRFHPFFDGKIDRVVNTAYEGYVFADLTPVAQSEFVGTVVNHRTVQTAMAEEFLLGHVARMQSRDLRHIVVPRQRRITVLCAKLIDQRERLLFEIGRVWRGFDDTRTVRPQRVYGRSDSAV
jgi:hypothetical protein